MKSKSICYSSLCPDLWLVLCRRCLNHPIICRLMQILFPVLFPIAEIQTCWHWTSYYLYLPICTAYVNHFVASVCPLHLLLIDGFEYYRQSMILLSLLFCNLYQIYVWRGPNTEPWGKPLLTLASLNVVPLTPTHCCLFDRKLCIDAHTDFTINSDFFEFAQ